MTSATGHARLGWWLALTPAAALLACAPDHVTRFHPLKVAVAAVAVWMGLIWLQPAVAPRRTTGLAVAFLGWGAISLAWSPAPGRGLQALTLLCLGALYFVLLLRWLVSAPDRALVAERLGRVWLWAGVVAAGIAFYQRLWGWRLGMHQVTGPVGNPNTLAVALVVVLPAGWLLARGRPGAPWRKRLFGGGGLVVLLAGIWATRCQAAWLAVAVMAAVVIGTSAWSLRRRLAMGGAFFAVLVLGALGRPMPGSVRSSLEGRWLIARVSAEVVSTAPVHGVGLGGYAHHAAWAQGAQLSGTSGPWSPLRDAHHQGLQVAAELGVVGLGLGLALLGALLWPVWRRRRDPVAQAALAAWAGLLAFSFSESALQRVEVLLPAVGWLALAHGLWAPRAAEGAVEPSPSGRHRWAPSALVAVGAVVGFVAVGDLRADWLHARGLARLASIRHRAPVDDELREVDRDFSSALASTSHGAELHLARALLRRARGLDAAARQDARRAFGLIPSPDRALLMGDLEAARGRGETAVWWYRLAVTLHPRYARGYNNLGVTLVRLEKRGLGCDTLRRAVSLRPFDPTIRGNWNTLCRPYHKPRRRRRPVRRSRPATLALR